MTILLALSLLLATAWALWERGLRQSHERTLDLWQARVTAANDEARLRGATLDATVAKLILAEDRVKGLEAELEQAKRNDRRDAKGRYCKPEEVH